MKVLAFVPYPKGQGPSQRFRLEIYQKKASEAGIEIHLEEFYSKEFYEIMYSPSKNGLKAWMMFKAYVKRYVSLFKLRRYDLIFIQREVSPIGPAIIPWLIRHVFRKPMVYDFDDAIWLPNYSDGNERFAFLKNYRKVAKMIHWSRLTIAGNEFLAQYAKQYGNRVCIIPTVIDEKVHAPSSREEGKTGNKVPTIGWTGSHSTMRHLLPIAPIIERLSQEFPLRFLVISNRAPSFDFPALEYRQWCAEQEIEDLREIDLGIMPIYSDKHPDFVKGKCGFKLIQYHALERPALASDSGVNSQVLLDGESGRLCHNEEEWEGALRDFLEQPESWDEKGQKGRAHILQNYSLQSQYEAFIEALRSAL